jgi:hypothetical protein
MGDSSGSNSSSFHLAAMAIETGMADAVLTYYTNSYGSATTRLWGNYGPNLGNMKETFETPYSNNEQIVNYAQMAHRYQHMYGLTEEQLYNYLGAIAINQRRNRKERHLVLKKPLDHEGYVNSPMIASPLQTRLLRPERRGLRLDHGLRRPCQGLPQQAGVRDGHGLRPDPTGPRRRLHPEHRRGLLVRDTSDPLFGAGAPDGRDNPG